MPGGYSPGKGMFTNYFANLSLVTGKTEDKYTHLKMLSATGSKWLRVRKIRAPPVNMLTCLGVDH